jgi:hypothetical protein
MLMSIFISAALAVVLFIPQRFLPTQWRESFSVSREKEI